MGMLACCVATRGAYPPAPRSLSPLVIQADDYFLGRWNPANARAGLALLRKDVAQSPNDYEGWWRIAKFFNFQAREAQGDAKIELLKQAIDAGEKAVALAPNRAEGHFWLGASEGLYAEESSYFAGIKMIEKIRNEMELVEKLDPDYENCSSQRTLARIYFRAPFFMGGDKRRSVVLLEDCLKRYPHDSLTMLYLGDSLYALGKKDEARAEFEEILKLCPDPLYAPEEAENQAEARSKLEQYFGEDWTRQAAQSPSSATRKSDVVKSGRQ
jgi:tetratricopeptide (TPR) repeat protein